MIIVEISPGIIALPEKEVRALYREFRSGGYRVYLLETGFNADREAFFPLFRKLFHSIRLLFRREAGKR